MEQTSILTKLHKEFLELVVSEPSITNQFYWTGGTVLSEFYLHHRDSHDLDLFSETEFDLDPITTFAGIAGKKLRAKHISHKQFLGLHTYELQFSKTILKIDFNYYPFPRINKGKTWHGLAIDSLEDIAVNKVHTLSTRARERDYIDLYFIMKNNDFTLPHLIFLAKAKFDWHIDPIQLGKVFVQVVTVSDIPRMLVPFTRQDMENFFLKLARDLGKDIFS